MIAAADVDGLATYFGLGGVYEGIGYVLHIGEVAGLLAVAYHGEGLTVKLLGQEYSEHGAVGASGA